MNRNTLAVAMACLLWTNAVASDEAIEIPLWPGVAPGSEASKLEEEYQDRPITDGTDTTRDRHVSGVKQPTLTVYLPDDEVTTGAMVVICPGGGFHILAIDKEGHDVARWLQAHGIAAAVVKYRLPDVAAGVYAVNASIPDVQRAIRIARHKASEWRIDPRRIGVTGFSAGGYLAAAVGTMFDEGDSQASDPIERFSCRPDFIAPIYPLISLDLVRDRPGDLLERMLGPQVTDRRAREYSPDRRVTPKTPPTFLVHAHDDRLSSKHSVQFYLALRQANVPAELHVYSQGGHGYGIRQRNLPISAWADRWLDWMRADGILDTKPNTRQPSEANP